MIETSRAIEADRDMLHRVYQKAAKAMSFRGGPETLVQQEVLDELANALDEYEGSVKRDLVNVEFADSRWIGSFPPDPAWHEAELKKTEAEAVDHPAHYGGKDNPFEAIKVIRAWRGDGAAFEFCICNAIKYLSRVGKKSGAPVEQDLSKTIWYLNYAKEIG